MPHWIALLAIVVAAWMIVAVVGGWLIGKGLAFLERSGDRERGRADRSSEDEVRRAA